MQTVWQRRVFISLGILIENFFVRFGPGFPNKTYKKRFGNQNLWFTGTLWSDVRYSNVWGKIN